MSKKYLIGSLVLCTVVLGQKIAPDLDFGGNRESSRGATKEKDRIPVIVQYVSGALEPEGKSQRRGVGRLIQPLASMDAEILDVTEAELEALKADTREIGRAHV